jgi:transposase
MRYGSDGLSRSQIAQVEAQVGPFQALVDRLDTIPGVNQRTAQTIIAEIGADMSRFSTAGHLASWAAVCPGNNESAGKHHSGRTRKGDTWLRAALGEAAAAASKTKNTDLQAQYRRLAVRRGKKRALLAGGHSILTAIWDMITNEVDYQDLGPTHFPTVPIPPGGPARLVDQLQQLGCWATRSNSTPSAPVDFDSAW